MTGLVTPLILVKATPFKTTDEVLLTHSHQFLIKITLAVLMTAFLFQSLLKIALIKLGSF